MSRTKVFNIKNSTVFAVVVAFIVFLMVGGCGEDDSSNNNPTTPPPDGHTHSYGAWVIVTPASCQAAGQEKRVCSCGDPQTQPIPQLTGAQCSGGGGVVDGGPLTFEGQTYRTVIIGGKRWMAENLNYETADSSWCYKNEPDSCKKYGRLYTWSRAVSACEAIGNGWRLPDTADWRRLVDVAGGWEVAGSKLKSQTGWYYYPGISSTDEFGFSALPGGYRITDGSFYFAGYYGNWWSATEDGSGYAYFRNMDCGYEYVVEYYYDKSFGFSVRCRAQD